MVSRRQWMWVGIVSVGTALLVGGCGQSGHAGYGDDGWVELAIVWPSSDGRAQARFVPEATDTVEIVITGSGISPEITASVTESDLVNGVGQVRLRIPPGSGRGIQVRAKNRSDECVAFGYRDLGTVTAGVLTRTSVRLAGGLVAYQTTRPGTNEIYTMRPDGSDITRVTVNPPNARPTWSPDGSQFATEGPGGGSTDIIVYDYVNGDTTGASITAGLPNADLAKLDPSWSPAGGAIAFLDSELLYEVCTVNESGGDYAQLTSGSYDRSPSFSPDGTRIAFARDPGSSYELYTVPASGGSVTRLTDDSYTDHDPAWSPDGTLIAFASLARDGGSVYDIYTIDVDTLQITQITNGSANERSPAWSEDGAKLLFVRSNDIYVIDADGRNEYRLTTDGATYSNDCPAWQPNWR